MSGLIPQKHETNDAQWVRTHKNMSVVILLQPDYQFFQRYLSPLKLVISKLFSNEGFFVYHQFFPGIY